MNDVRYGVWLHRKLIGHIDQRLDYTVFRFTDDYLNDSSRAVLGLHFEEHLQEAQSCQLRLPPWFSNLLPEGRLRDWIALDRGVSSHREMELLAQVGHDLAGAVQVVRDDSEPDELSNLEDISPIAVRSESGGRSPGWRFSLAGVALKFSMLAEDDRLTIPAFGEGGDWIVKLPDPTFRQVPVNENAMMTLASRVGIEIPEHKLVHRDQIANLPTNVWRSSEDYAYAVQRFDRGAQRKLIHIEDFAQVRDLYPDKKYSGNFETVAALAYRGYDMRALEQVVRRIAFVILVSNGDAHLKNWSLIYRDIRKPTLAPAYDLVSTEVYRDAGDAEDLGLRFDGTRRLASVRLSSFSRLGGKLGVDGDFLVSVVTDTISRVETYWPEISSGLQNSPWLVDAIDISIKERRKTLTLPLGV